MEMSMSSRLNIQNKKPIKRNPSTTIRCTRQISLTANKELFECFSQNYTATSQSELGDLELKTDRRSISVDDIMKTRVVNWDDNSNTEQIDFPLRKEMWTNMTENDRNLWIKKYLYKIKNEVIVTYKIISDFRKGTLMPEELSEISTLLSMVDIAPTNKLRSAGTQEITDYFTVAIQLKELQERHKDVTIELNKTKRSEKSLREQVNKVKCDNESQTHGVSIEQLYSQLDASNVMTENLKRDIDIKNSELKRVLAENSVLNSKIQKLNKTIEDQSQKEFDKAKLLKYLYEQNNKHKCSFIDASRDKDDAEEKFLLLEEKFKEKSENYSKLQSKLDEITVSSVHYSMNFSDQIDQINEKTNQISHLEKIITKQEELIKCLEQDSYDSNKTIASLEENVAKLNNEISSWETGAVNWVNTHVRDSYSSRIEMLEKEIVRLKIKNTQLSTAYESTIAKKSEQIENKNKIIMTKQMVIGQQEEVIRLLRNIQRSQMTNTDKKLIYDTINSVFLKYDDAIRHIFDSEELIMEKERLKLQVIEFKQRLNSKTYTQLLQIH